MGCSCPLLFPSLAAFYFTFLDQGLGWTGQKMDTWIHPFCLDSFRTHTQTCPPDFFTYKINVRQSQSTAKNGNERSTSQPTSSDLSVGLWESSPNDLIFQDI